MSFVVYMAIELYKYCVQKYNWNSIKIYSIYRANEHCYR